MVRAAVVLRFWAGVTAGFVLVAAGALVALAVVPSAVGLTSSTVVGSGSMAPALRIGDVVLLEDVDARATAIEPPTVVLVEDPARERPLLHRVVGVAPDESGYRTKGDANLDEDSDVVAPELVQGTGRVLVPLVGTPLLWAQDGALLPLAALLAAVAGLAGLARYGWSDGHDPWTRERRTEPPAVPRQREPGPGGLPDRVPGRGAASASTVAPSS